MRSISVDPGRPGFVIDPAAMLVWSIAMQDLEFDTFRYAHIEQILDNRIDDEGGPLLDARWDRF
jgi:hypothetical protein